MYALPATTAKEQILIAEYFTTNFWTEIIANIGSALLDSWGAR